MLYDLLAMLERANLSRNKRLVSLQHGDGFSGEKPGHNNPPREVSNSSRDRTPENDIIVLFEVNSETMRPTPYMIDINTKVEIIMLSEMSQTGKGENHDITYMWEKS